MVFYKFFQCFLWGFMDIEAIFMVFNEFFYDCDPKQCFHLKKWFVCQEKVFIAKN